MSKVSKGPLGIGTQSVDERANRRRWYVLRYLRTCEYPATVTELSEYVKPRLGSPSDGLEDVLRNRDLTALAECGAIEYDPESRLACLNEEESFAERVRSAITEGVVTHLKPARIEPVCEGVFYRYAPIADHDDG
jgi:hypothetical protein